MRLITEPAEFALSLFVMPCEYLTRARFLARLLNGPHVFCTLHSMGSKKFRCCWWQHTLTITKRQKRCVSAYFVNVQAVVLCAVALKAELEVAVFAAVELEVLGLKPTIFGAFFARVAHFAAVYLNVVVVWVALGSGRTWNWIAHHIWRADRITTSRGANLVGSSKPH